MLYDLPLQDFVATGIFRPLIFCKEVYDHHLQSLWHRRAKEKLPQSIGALLFQKSLGTRSYSHLEKDGLIERSV
jgi:hypothetical protein